jgi:hypothetical protein
MGVYSYTGKTGSLKKELQGMGFVKADGIGVVTQKAASSTYYDFPRVDAIVDEFPLPAYDYVLSDLMPGIGVEGTPERFAIHHVNEDVPTPAQQTV